MAMFGKHLISAEEKRAWFTHKGWFAFCPVWLGNLDSDAPLVATRNGIPEIVMDAAEACIGLCIVVISLFNPDYEPLYPIRVSGELFPATPKKE